LGTQPPLLLATTIHSTKSSTTELDPAHLKALREDSGLSAEVIAERGYRTVRDRVTLRDLGFKPAQRLVPGLLMPILPPDGSNGLYCFRPDFPRTDTRGRMIKYEFPAGKAPRLDSPSRCHPALKDPSIPAWLTEGIKKGDSLASHGLCAISLLGVWLFLGKNEYGGVTLLSDFDLIAWTGRKVHIVFDNDVMLKAGVRAALERLIEHVRRKGAIVTPIYLPPGPNGEKIGVDDYLLTHSIAELEALVEAPKPAPKAAEPLVELLEVAPPTISRPLVLLSGQSYAATWLWAKRTITESLNKAGEVIRHDPQIQDTRRELFIVRGDGVCFGPGADRPLDELGVEVRLPSPPRDIKLWRTSAVAAYRARKRPDPADVFARLVGIFDRFVDFNASVAPQSDMCELSACLSVSTWFSPAFTVLGYPWPIGDRGAGKTTWGLCWAATSYLGEVLTMGGSFAALRDLAEYGAALVFDDAENLSDPKRVDPDKRALLLAGNRRGASIPLKEQAPDGTWRIRWVNAFCPRAFTSIGEPDHVLRSRSLPVPLARTDDPARGNADPANPASWPCDQRTLQDDLWATALALLPEAERVWTELDGETAAVGRDLEPWRAVLAVARLFERHRVDGLEARIRGVMAAYAEEKAEAVAADWTTQVIRALRALVDESLPSDTLDTSDAADTLRGGVGFSSSQISEKAKSLADEGEESGEWATPTRVGKMLSKLRLKRERQGDRKRSRRWLVNRDQLARLERAYGLTIPSRNDEKTNSEVSDPPLQVSALSEVSNVSAPAFWERFEL
jgi:hypothetical protein